MFDRISTGKVSKKWGYIITIGASSFILMIVLSGYFFNSQNKVAVKTEEKRYSVENNLKYAEKVASELSRNISSLPESEIKHEEPSKYDAKEAFSDSTQSSMKYSSKSLSSDEKSLSAPELTISSEDYLREYIKYKEKGNLLDRNGKPEVYSYTADASRERANEKSQRKSAPNPNRTAEYNKAKASPTRVNLRFNHDELSAPLKHTNESAASSGDKGKDSVFSASEDRNTSFDKEQQTLSKYEVFERNSFSLDNEVVKPKTPFALMQGTVIPAILSSGINSELPGQVSAMVTRDIKDSIRGRFLLIPKGSKLLGQYGSTAAFGSQRLFLGFNRIIFPNGYSLSLGSMPGQSPDGYAGFDAEVDNHFFRILSNCFFLSSITTAASSVQQTYGTSSGVGTLYTSQARELSSDVSEALGRIIERNINLAPTLKVQPGYKFTISLTKDIFFKEPYGANYEEYFIKY